jgi:hypothetical protein
MIVRAGMRASAGAGAKLENIAMPSRGRNERSALLDPIG